eukprot:TRINITY_DN5376_c0_g2_i4.p1 TRINITY_DN5376_c0_g2~~TRINITY_DN5376_c0_g2_i4.p1  ORF type:complete len:2322 (+),score=604.66 TRINITY_DN5376_c0_g2_i4:75-7040(+)
MVPPAAAPRQTVLARWCVSPAAGDVPAPRRRQRPRPLAGRRGAVACGAAALLAAACRCAAQQDTIPQLVALRSSGAASGTLVQSSAALLSSGLSTTLGGSGPYTLFAPSDSAWARLPGGTIDMLMEAKAATDLRVILSSHAAAGTIAVGSISNGDAITTLQPSTTLHLNKTVNGSVTATLRPPSGPNASLTVTDLVASNGVVHIISRLLVPASVELPEESMSEVAEARGLTQWKRAADASGLAEQLNSEAQSSSLTCFAPTDDAWDALPQGLLSLLLADQGSLAKLIHYHCVSAFLPSARLATYASYANGTNRVSSKHGADLILTQSNGTLTVRSAYAPAGRRAEPEQAANAATVLQSDVFTTSGVLHVVNRILVPAGFVWPGSFTSPTPPPATWTASWPTPWIHCPQIPYERCPELLPLNADPVDEFASTQVTVQVQAWCNGSPLGGLASGSCAAHSNWEVLDDGGVVSTLEAQLSVSVAPGTVLSLIMVDLSNSVNQNSQALGWRKQAAIRYIEKVLSPQSVALTGPHRVAVYAFDGRRETQLVTVGVGPSGWSDNAANLVAAVNALECGAKGSIEYCRDPSTNLHGALRWGARHLQDMALPTALDGRNTSCGLDAFLVFFTDGLDQANYGATALDVQSEIRLRGVKALGVAHEGDTTYRSVVETIVGDPQGVFVATERARLPEAFEAAAAAAVAYASRAYQLTYCSPRRAGSHALQVRARYSGVTGPTMGFVAGQRVLHGAAEAGTITSVDRYNTDGNQYVVTFPSGRAVISTAADIALTYSTASFLAPACLRHRTDPSGLSVQEATLPYAAPDSQLVQQGLAPYSCTGGGEYSCAAQQCRCGQAAGSVIGTHCPLTSTSLPVASTAVRECLGGFPGGPLSFTRFNQSADSRISLDFNASCRDGLPFGGISFSPCETLSSLRLLESDSTGVFRRVSLYESRPRITCLSDPVHVLSLLLLDTSASVVRGSGGLPTLKAAVLAYLDGLRKKLPSHTVAMHTFDGRAGTRELMGFSSDINTAKNAINRLTCDGTAECVDPASNLYGAVVHVHQTVLRDFHNSALAVAPDGSRRQPYLVIFSDGTDSAARATLQQAVQVAALGRSVIAVGLQGEVAAPSMSFSARGADSEALNRLSTNGVFIADTEDLAAAFKGVADAIATSSATRFRLDYCSPKRNGVRTLRLQFTPQGGASQGQTVTYWEQSFDATQFRCDDGGCTRCLGGLNNNYMRKSCSNQPGPFQQSFVCESEAAPVAISGFCRCPCSSAAAYPPASQEGPGPIKCDVPGVCYAPRPTAAEGVCAPRGGLPPARANSVIWTRTGSYWSAGDGTRFGTAPNSHVSIEFVPMCADGWNIPGLRLSACPGLSDFRVLETDAATQNAPVEVDPWESEPRVLCHPDILTLILLDTSGSIRQGDSGEQSLRDGVARYLSQVNTTVQELDITHLVAIHAFDGRDHLQQIVSFTDPKTALDTMTAWGCDGTHYCVDPSTDLNGALVRAEAVVRAEQQGLSWTTKPFIILFTDGTDQAARQTAAAAAAQLQTAEVAIGLRVYGVGLIGETQEAAVGFDEDALKELAFSDVFVASSTALLAEQFGRAAEAVQDAVLNAGTATYRIDYCSPKRNGLRRTIIRLSLEGSSFEWYGPTFNASEFSCATGACTGCLRNRQFSCPYQPQHAPGDRDPQFFSCDGGSPVVIAGADGERQCKCPCPGTYPPDPTPAPTPAPTAPPGTAAIPPVIQCQSAGQAPRACSSTIAAPFTVSMSTATPLALILYTTDGSLPSAASALYTAPFAWTRPGSVTFRAIATRTGLQPSTVAAATVFVISTNVGTPAPTAATSAPVLSTNNQIPTATVAIPVVTASGVGVAVTVSGVLTGVSGPEAGQTVAATCTSRVTDYFAMGPSMTVTRDRGDLAFAVRVGASVASAAVTCVLTDDGSPPRSRTVEFTVRSPATLAPTAAATVHPACPTADARRDRAMRLRLGLSAAAFSAASFASAVRSAVSVPTLVAPFVCVFSVCPAAACPLACPVSSDAKRRAGCLVDADVPAARAAAVLQGSIVVEFDLALPSSTSQAAADAARERAFADLNADVQRCSTGSCALSSQQPSGSVTWVPTAFTTPAPPSSDDDELLSTPALIGVIVGGVLFLLLLVFLVVLCCCKPKEKGAGTAKDKELDTTGAAEGGVSRAASGSQERMVKSPGSLPPPARSRDASAGWEYLHGDPRSSPAKQVSVFASLEPPLAVSPSPPRASCPPSAPPFYSSPPGARSVSAPSSQRFTPAYTPGQKVRALYLDGVYYDATVWAVEPDGCYSVQWYDGTHSNGLPSEQLQGIA